VPDWPPDEAGWRSILENLPSEGDQAAVRAAVEEAVREFDALGAEPPSLVEQRIEKVDSAIRQLRTNPAFQQLWELGVDDSVVKKAAAARDRLTLGLPRRRNNRLRARLTLAWTGPGRGKLAIGSGGPLVRFLTNILDRIEPLEPEGIKEALRRERDRRDAINILTQRVLAGQGAMRSNAFIVHSEGNVVDRSRGG
jgi:hypothetical protein